MLGVAPRLIPAVPLPETIPTRISSEAAGYISMTPVARQELSVAELVERILAVTGKDVGRIREILDRGSFVSGASRYRWPGVETDEADLKPLLQAFPDPQPDRPFDAARCRRVLLHGVRGTVEIDYDTATKRRLLRKRSYWDVLISMLAALAPVYQRYSYADQADVYVTRLPLETTQRLEQEADLLKYSSIMQQVRRLAAESADLFVDR